MTSSKGLPYTQLGQAVVTNRADAFNREWLLTNGIGGFASASLSGANTRRYHGLLIAALKPPLGRTVLLGKLDETIQLAGGNSYSLDVNEWRGGAATLDGLTYLTSFELNGNLPTFHYNLNGVALSKTIWMEYGSNTVYVRYSCTAASQDQPFELRVHALANYRDYHSLTHGSPDHDFSIQPEEHQSSSWLVQAWPDATPWRLMTFERPVQWRPDEAGGWYWGFHYQQEAARGMSETDEDMYCLGTWITTLSPGQSVTFAASLETAATVESLQAGAYERELARLAALLTLPPVAKPYPTAEYAALAQRLTLAADQFLVGRPVSGQPGSLQPDYRTVIAGYPWFSDWGRDTMISLAGLTLATGRYAEAATILRSFSRFVSKGMLPNRFPDSAQPLGEDDYNTVDATLWYFDAVDKYLTARPDLDLDLDPELGRELYPVLADIIDWHVRGTRFGIGLVEDGLLASGVPGVQLTWMDAKIGEWVVTPRRGKPIEINALWYRACRVMEKLAESYGTPDDLQRYAELAERVMTQFEKTYWYAEGNYFYDNIDDSGKPDASLRPNQVIALAVAPVLFSPDKARLTLEKVKQELLTPYGLRTLDRHNPDYHPYYQGNQLDRDSAYHQGTIWPWLLGSYAQAQVQFNEASAVSVLTDLLTPFLSEINEAGVGQISEIFGAEPPFPPVGCIAQAWSVAQLLEIWQLLLSRL